MEDYLDPKCHDCGHPSSVHFGCFDSGCRVSTCFCFRFESEPVVYEEITVTNPETGESRILSVRRNGRE